MRENKDYNNPKKIFKEKGGVELPKKSDSAGEKNLSSVRQSEITSIVPDEINWSRIYSGKRPIPDSADRNSPK
jgi:hypothetical protein